MTFITSFGVVDCISAHLNLTLGDWMHGFLARKGSKANAKRDFECLKHSGKQLSRYGFV